MLQRIGWKIAEQSDYLLRWLAQVPLMHNKRDRIGHRFTIRIDKTTTVEHKQTELYIIEQERTS
jgi:hypothetical protein